MLPNLEFYVPACLGAKEESNSSGRVCGDLSDGILDRWENSLDKSSHVGNQIKVQPNALGLSTDDSERRIR
jgi:hypothetical protein